MSSREFLCVFLPSKALDLIRKTTNFLSESEAQSGTNRKLIRHIAKYQSYPEIDDAVIWGGGVI